ncbi:hypothetical protein ES703_100767 [subsurface metagenome]
MKQIVSLSGGKDSTAMLLMMLEKGEQIDNIVFFDWGMEFPQMYEHLEKLEDYIKRPITRLYPKHSWDYYMFDHIHTRGKRKGEAGNGWGWGKSPWCTREKTNAFRSYQRDATSVCIGFTYSERFRRPTYKYNQRYPLLEWGVTSQEALNYCYLHGFFFGELYKWFKSVSCWCCPLKSYYELQALRDNFPDLWQKLLDMDIKSPYPHPKAHLLKELRS